jgi:hypothetical protein
MRAFWKRWWTENDWTGRLTLILGLFVFTPAVIAALVALNMSRPVVPSSPALNEYQLAWRPGDIVLDSGAPSWVSGALARGEMHLPRVYGLPRGSQGQLHLGYGHVVTRCFTDREGKTFSYPCWKGKVVIALWPQAMAACTGDECELGLALRKEDSCTILLPDHLAAALPAGVYRSDLPADLEDMVMMHEWMHCLGKGHVYTPLIGDIVGRPTGHLMHPNISLIGWRTEGL